MTIPTQIAQALVLYLLLLTATLICMAVVLKKYRDKLFVYLAALTIYVLVSAGTPLLLALDGFHMLNLLAWGCFAGGLAALLVIAIFARKHFRVFSTLMFILAGVNALVGIDAFFIEPHWLSIREVNLTSAKLKSPLTIAIASDIQTDDVGDYERRVLTEVLKAKPDLILLPGDYIQEALPRRTKEEEKLRRLMTDLKFSAPLGVYAVRGNVEADDWVNLFTGLPIKIFPNTETLPVRADVDVCGLSFKDSFDPKYVTPGNPTKYRIAFGHGPDFALGKPSADLLVAGHTHGGQFNILGAGPVLTCSRVPNAWAAGGVFQVNPGTTLILTRGVGMERWTAPRMRFCCRPEIVIAHIQPVRQ